MAKTSARSKSISPENSANLDTTSFAPIPWTKPSKPSSEPWRPHAYQKRAVRFLLEHACAALFLDPGLGKSSIVLAALKFLLKRGLVSRVLVIAPLRVCYQVWPAEAKKWSDFAGLRVSVLHGPKKEEALAAEADIYVVNPEGLDWLFDVKKTATPSGKVQVRPNLARAKKLGFDTLVFDECFPSGTKILTPSGRRSIENLRVGSLVKTDVGTREVLRLVKNEASSLVKLELSNGQEIHVTPEHPFFTDAGWVPAEHLEGRRLYRDFEMRNLRYNFSTESVTNKTSVCERAKAVLLKELLPESSLGRTTRNDAGGENTCRSENAGATFLEQGEALVGGVQKGFFCAKESERVHDFTREPRRQRSRDDEIGNVFSPSVARKIYLQLRRVVGEEVARISYELQVGLRGSYNEDGRRSGWEQPLREEGTRSEEGSEAGVVRVARVTHQQFDGIQDVWNLEVEGVNRYYAEGFLVHNCTLFKNHSAGRYKLMKQLLHLFGRRWGLTGSPTANGLLPLFGQCYMLDQGNALGPYFMHYRDEFFTQPKSDDRHLWVLRPGAKEKIYRKVAPLALRMSAEEYLALPELVPLKRFIELPPKARAAYDALEEDLISKIEERIVTAANAGAASMKCRQIASGAIYLDSEVSSLIRPPRSAREWAEVHTEKLDSLEELLEELQGAPLLLGYYFEHDLERLLGRFPDTPYVGGGVSPKRAAEIEGAWNAGRLPLVFGHPQSMGHGLNLQGVAESLGATASHVGLFSQLWDYEVYDQFVRRVRRQGNAAKRTFVHHFVAKDTVEEIQIYSGIAKGRGQNEFFEALKALSKNRRQWRK